MCFLVVSELIWFWCLYVVISGGLRVGCLLGSACWWGWLLVLRLARILCLLFPCCCDVLFLLV